VIRDVTGVADAACLERESATRSARKDACCETTSASKSAANIARKAAAKRAATRRVVEMTRHRKQCREDAVLPPAYKRSFLTLTCLHVIIIYFI